MRLVITVTWIINSKIERIKSQMILREIIKINDKH